jgi:hypothetical protein
VTLERRRRVNLLQTLVWTLVWCGLPTPASAIDARGYLQQSLSVGTDDGEILLNRQTINMQLDADPERWLDLRMAVDLWRDQADFMDDGEVRTRLREGYAKVSKGPIDVRLGRFQVAWGEADGIIISDQITPFDYENFILQQFDEIRLGVDGALIDYWFDNGNQMQLVWLGHFTPPDFPNQRSPWALLSKRDFAPLTDRLPFPVDLEIAPDQRPANTLRNSEFGIRFSGHPVIADWSVGYFRSFDDRPAPRIRATFDPLNPAPAAVLVLPTHDLFDMFMLSVAYPVGDVLLRLDSAYEHGRFLSYGPTTLPSSFPPSDPSELAPLLDAIEHEFVTRQDVSRTMLAVDMKPEIRWWEQADLTLQYVHEEVVDPHPGLLVPVHTDYLSLRATAAYRNETIKPWLFVIANARGEDTWVQAKVDYEPIDDWRFTLEYDNFIGHLYNGHSGGIFGRFDANDLFQFTIRYSY